MKKMDIYTLTGKSGTGKSYQAMTLCKKLNIESIIDDGLFIWQNTIIEGESAKRSATKIGAIKTAIFNDPEKAKKVKDAVTAKSPESILILGTSDAMTDIIMERLGLTGEIHRIYIEDITTEEERNAASEERKHFGKHVIPVPSLELKKSFAGYFLDQLKTLWGKDKDERTVVRPTYSYMGDYIVSEKVIGDIVKLTAKNDPSVNRVIMVMQEASPESYKISISVRMNRGYPIWESVYAFQKKLNDTIESMTAFNITEVNVEVRRVV